MSSQKKIIVIGNGMVGFKFCQKLAEQGGLNAYHITVFGEEPHPAYDRVHLSEYFSGKAPEAFYLAPRSWYAEQGIELITGQLVVQIQPTQKSVITQSGEHHAYDILILATGSAAFVPPIAGADKPGVFVYRTLEDLEHIIEYGKQAKTAAVIGGGLLGLEAAKAVQDMGLSTIVIERAPHLMARQLDASGAKLLQAKIEAMGIQVMVSANTQLVGGEQAVTHVQVDDQTIDLDMVVISAGIKPRDELARQGGLQVGARGGILVDSCLKTSDPDIYAIGECALFEEMIYGLVAPGYQMAQVVVDQLLGKTDSRFQAADMSTSLKLLGVEVASFGDSTYQGDDVTNVVLNNEISGVYKKLIIAKDTATIVGGLLVGDAAQYNTLHQMMMTQAALPEVPESLLVPSTGEASAPVAISDGTLLCFCEGVTKGTLVEAINQQGACTLDQIKECTKAGSGCGGCVPMVKDVLAAELKKQGVTVSQALCEHFPLSREALRVQIKEHGYREFDKIVSKLGQGAGCEKCKPVVASILSGIWGDNPLAQQTIQDTNDYFLANIQKNGSYSVVPRVPGGEITPDQLITIGQVAKEFNLYSKITGGQRIDLLGARQEDLPAIWQRLIEAGMESGQAYGKALRTVKSCVGWTWCRFGVQDSTGLAIKVERRYRGLRAPHKLKGGVSGCARECAEARGKDFGIIATELGWNLYVCGNGGTKPQHAELLAGDISEQEVIRYLDRFLMYYLRTAKHLQRTAPWLNEFEGGLKRLKEIIVEDCLGIGAELESEMQHLVDHYECEWQAVLRDPEKLKRFKPFLNSEDRDESIRFVQERGQIRPDIGDARLVQVEQEISPKKLATETHLTEMNSRHLKQEPRREAMLELA